MSLGTLQPGQLLSSAIAIHIDTAHCRREGQQCTSPVCDDMCIVVNQNHFCGCKTGRRLTNGSHCEDTDECQFNADCHVHQTCLSNHNCYNTCNQGFHPVLDTNSGKKTCMSKCVVPDNTVNATREQSNVTYVNVGEKILYNCIPNLTLSAGSLTRTCMFDFTWTGDPPVCLEKIHILAGSSHNTITSEDSTTLSTVYSSTGNNTSTGITGIRDTTTPIHGGRSTEDTLSSVMALGIGIGIGAFLLMLLVIIIALLCLRRRKRKRDTNPAENLNLPVTRVENDYSPYQLATDSNVDIAVHQSGRLGEEPSEQQNNMIPRFKETMEPADTNVYLVSNDMYASTGERVRNGQHNNSDQKETAGLEECVMVDNDIYSAE
ncbi:uncharacterized protein LOC106155261 isoform X1 [Lingula anatina]|uniref:Uncharacterized protein LOC106155261 isoform X1 n=1 Tax=Lingula anatina TaxID=7574 RepID=A0A1S3HJ20_LINAN|nr:uncharacterized protein LOC106155261 isoform X1 [Lingula anatina]|eukprot:XP_013385456.1 uncharacterized protein LOC106155261 isoform X1 [Lingula anatina]